MNITIVPESSGVGLGRVCWWNLSDLDMGRLREIWTAKSLPAHLFPGEPTPGDALRGAVHSVAKIRRLVRPLDTRSAYGIVNEAVQGKTLVHSHELVAELVPHPINAGAMTIRVTPEDHPLAASLRAAYAESEGSVPHHKVSTWLSQRVMPALRAIALKGAGGIYFVPPESVDMLEHVRQALEAANGGRITVVPAGDPAAIALDVIEGIAREVEARETAAARELEKEPGAKRLRTLIDAEDAFLGKIARYEAVLGSKLDDVRAKIETMKATMAAAMIQEMVAEDTEEPK